MAASFTFGPGSEDLTLEQILSVLSAGGLNFTDTGAISSGSPELDEFVNTGDDTERGDFSAQLNQFSQVLPFFLEQINAETRRAEIAAANVRSSNQTGAQLAAAGIGANATIASATLQAQTQLTALEATINNDIKMANLGFDINTQQFNANIEQRARLANAAKSVEIAQLAGSGQARDNIARLLSIGSGAATPGAFSAFSGLPSPFIDPTQGQTSFNPIPEFGGFGPLNFDFPTFNTEFTPAPIPGGGGGGGLSLADIFAQLADLSDFGGGGGGFNVGDIQAGGSSHDILKSLIDSGSIDINDIGGLKSLFGFARGTKGRRPTKGIVGDSTDGKPNPELVIAPGGFQVIPMKESGKTAKGVKKFEHGTEINLFGQEFDFDPDISDIDLLKGPLKSLLDLPTIKEFGQGFASTEALPPTPHGNFNQRILQFNPTGSRFAGIPSLFQGASRFGQLQGGQGEFLQQFLEFLGINRQEQQFQLNAANPAFSFQNKRALSFI